MNANFASAYNNRGYLYYFQKGDVDQAIIDYDQAIKIQPDFAQAYINRGIAYHKKGAYDQAIANYDQMLTLKLNDRNTYYAFINRGYAYYWKSDYNRAIADYNRAITFQSDQASAYTKLEDAYFAKRDPDGLIADYDRILVLYPDNAYVYYRRGLAQRRVGHSDKTILDMRKCLELSNDPELRRSAELVLQELNAKP